MPWLPQTTASLDIKQIARYAAVAKRFPACGLEVVVGIAAGRNDVHNWKRVKPNWRDTKVFDFSERPSNEEYITQVQVYSQLAIGQARTDITKLNDLIDRFVNLSRPAQDEVLAFLRTKDVADLTELERLPLWESLIGLAKKHRRHSDVEWAMSEADLVRIEEAAAALKPKKSGLIHRRLFSEIDHELYDESGDWDTQKKNLEAKRRDAVKDVLATDGIVGVIEFARTVAKPGIVGASLAEIDEPLANLADLSAACSRATK